MPGYDKAHYRAKGALAYEVGVYVVAFVWAAGWQKAAYREGYMQARTAWRKANPGGDEMKAGAERCKAMHYTGRAHVEPGH